MRCEINYFKRKLHTHQQIGLWLGLAHHYSAEIAATVGFDWLMIDAEHAPNDLRSILQQLQSIAAYPNTQVVVRPAHGDACSIKQLLDLGVQTLLIPMVESAQQAQQIIDATRYPPLGTRGVGAALARASRWNQIPDYLQFAEQEICLLLQVESRRGIENLAEILALDGVDGVFIGPADLSADMDHLGHPEHPEVQQVIDQSIEQIRAAGIAAGILSADEQLAQHYLELGAEFVAVGIDTRLLLMAMKQLLLKFMLR